MTNDKSKIASKLNDVLQKNRDAREGYQKAAEEISNPQLRTYFDQRAQKRQQFEGELSRQISTLGGEPSTGTSVAADLHRGWMGLRDSMSNGDEAVCKECIRGEESFVNEYDELINSYDLQPEMKESIMQQRQDAQSAISELRTINPNMSN